MCEEVWEDEPWAGIFIGCAAGREVEDASCF